MRSWPRPFAGSPGTCRGIPKWAPACGWPQPTSGCSSASSPFASPGSRRWPRRWPRRRGGMTPGSTSASWRTRSWVPCRWRSRRGQRRRAAPTWTGWCAGRSTGPRPGEAPEAGREERPRSGPLRGCREGRSAGPTPAGHPGLAQLAALLFGGAAPDPGLLVGGEGELEAGGLRVARLADGLGGVDLLEGGARGADREEEVRIGVSTGGVQSPVVLVPVDRSAPGEGHDGLLAVFREVVHKAVTSL